MSITNESGEKISRESAYNFFFMHVQRHELGEDPAAWRRFARAVLRENDWTRSELSLALGKLHKLHPIVHSDSSELWSTLRREWAGNCPFRQKLVAVNFLTIVEGWTQPELCLATSHDKSHVCRMLQRFRIEMSGFLASRSIHQMDLSIHDLAA